MTKREIEARLAQLTDRMVEDNDEWKMLQAELKKLNENDSGQQTLLLG